MKSIRQLYSLLFWGIALIVITLFNSCGPHVAPEMQTLFVYGDSLKKVTISYYDLGNKTETVTLPFLTGVRKEYDAPSSDKFYVTVCDTSSTYRGLICGDFAVGDSCDANSIIAANFSGNPNMMPRGCSKMSNDSLLNYAKKIAYPGYFEMKKGSTSGCQTITPY